MVFNEAMLALDFVVAAAVDEPPRNDPPASPVIGSAYIVGAAPTGDWAGKARSLAAFTGGGWRFVSAQDGLTAFVRSTGARAIYRDGAWQIGSAIASPAGGTTVDAEARSAIGLILSALVSHGLVAG